MSENNSNIGFFNRLLLSKEGVKLLENGTDIKELLTESFDSELVILKVIFILLFIVCAVVNKYLDFIKSHPITFAIETAIYGVSGSIPFLYMEAYRKDPYEKKHYLFMFIVMFLLYSFFNVIFEIGGIYSWLYEEDEEEDVKSKEVHETKPKETKHKLIYDGLINSIFLTIFLILTYMIILLFLSTFKVFDFNITEYKNNFYLAFIFETIIFSLFNSIPFFLVAYNREGSKFNLNKNAIEVGLIFAKFVIFHLLLQGSGFYKHSLGY